MTRYDTHAKTNGISGVGVPPGADAKVGDATTVILVYERLFGPNFGVELVMGIPPTIKAKATGSVEFLNATGTVLSAENWAPTLLFNYHFFEPGATWRPYVGAGINYTKFKNAKSSIASDVELGSSWGPAVQVGIEYAITKDINAFASLAAVKVKSKVVATGAHGADDDGRLPADGVLARRGLQVLSESARGPAGPQCRQAFFSFS